VRLYGGLGLPAAVKNFAGSGVARENGCNKLRSAQSFRLTMAFPERPAALSGSGAGRIHTSAGSPRDPCELLRHGDTPKIRIFPREGRFLLNNSRFIGKKAVMCGKCGSATWRRRP
jgi:hypothetical protein